MTTSSGSILLIASPSSRSAGSILPAMSMGAAPPSTGLVYELTWEQMIESSWSVIPSKQVPFGRTFLSSTWFFSQRPFCPDCSGSQ